MTQLIECQDLPKNKQNKRKIFQTCFRNVSKWASEKMKEFDNRYTEVLSVCIPMGF